MQWTVCFGFVFLTLGACGCGQASTPPPVYLGHVAARSGPGMEAGDQAAAGIRLALEELNQDANLRPFYVRNVDTQGKLEAFESLAIRLTTVNQVEALLGGDAPEQVSKLARAKALIMSPAGHRPRELGDNVFTTGLMPSLQGETLAHFAWNTLGKARWVIVLDESKEEMLMLARAFEKEMAAAAPDPKTKLTPKVTTIPIGKYPKMGELGTRVLLENPQGVLFAGQTGDLSILLPELEKPRDLAVLAGDANFQRLAATEQEPIYAATTFVMDPEYPQAIDFGQKYKKAFGNDPDAHAALAYEGMRLLGDTARKAFASGQRVREQLVMLKDFPGLLGPLSFESDRQMRRPAVVVRWDGSRMNLMKSVAKSP